MLKARKRRTGRSVKLLDLKQGVASIASASEVGEYYQYVIDQKISLPRQKSAMLPILNQNIEGEKVSIYNPATHAKFPLLGLRLKNSSGQPLNQGPITVYEDNSYSGDTRILDLNAGEERLLSYALDQGVEVKTDVKATPSPDMHFAIGTGNLTAMYQMRETRTYTIKNRAKKDRTVILEHAIRGGWTLVEPKKATETTRDLYRFQVTVPAGKTVTFDVVEEQPRADNVALNSQPQYVAGTGISVKYLVARRSGEAEGSADPERLHHAHAQGARIEDLLRAEQLRHCPRVHGRSHRSGRLDSSGGGRRRSQARPRRLPFHAQDEGQQDRETRRSSRSEPSSKRAAWSRT